DSEITFNEVTRKFSITPKETRFSFWQFIVRIAFFKRYEGFEITLPNESGLYLIYIFRDEEDQTHRQQKLFYIKDPDIDDIREVYLNRVIVAWVHYNDILKKALYFGDSRHGSEWNPQMHWMLHQTINSQRQEGISITGATYDGDGTLESDYLL